MKQTILWGLLFYLLIPKLGTAQSDKDLPFAWENANVYFVLTDRFENGDPSNDFSYGRQRNGPALRSFEGGDLQGLINKLDEGYFDDLGVSAIWITPPYENIHGSIGDAGYAFHGYWAKDWTTIDQNLGSEDLFRQFVDVSHEHGIRVIMDVVLNHVGPDNSADQSWPNEWVRRDPTCNFQGPGGNIPCELVDNLPDILTESNNNVGLPGWLLDKWSNEGRRGEEEAELNDFFNRTGKSRSPRQYIIKWLTDYVRKFGVDGFRVDTVKHVEEFVWKELEEEGRIALREWKNNNPNKKIDDRDFWMTGEIFNYMAPSMGRRFTGDGFNIDYYDNGFDNLINFEFRFNANDGLESIFSKYDNLLFNQLGSGKSALNFLANHDTEQVFDRDRTRTFEAGTKLLLTPGPAQIYYGDETARTLTPGGGAFGDATLRSNMNFNELSNTNSKAYLTLEHFKKLGRFRREHISVGGGRHSKLQDSPYTFKREYNGAEGSDKTLVYSGNDGDFNGSLDVFGMWPDGTQLKDYFSGNVATVSGGDVNFGTSFGLVLIGVPASTIQIDNVTLSINPVSGLYTEPLLVTMSATSSSGSATSIFYTTDGSNPTASSTLYSSSFDISNTTIIRAIAIDTEGNESEVITRNYVIGDGEPFNVYFKKPSSWSSANIYLFNQNTGDALPGFPAWPGVIMNNVEGTPWLTYNIDQDVQVGIVFNDNGGDQTDDLTRVTEGWYDNQWFDSCPSECPTISQPPVLTVSPDSGTFIGNVQVSMNATNSGVIYYTLDGSVPDVTSTLYDGSFIISEVGITELNAIAINSTGSSAVISKNYTIQDVSGYTVNFRKPDNWSTSYIYLYDRNADAAIPGFPAWPGIQMTQLSDSPWYSYTIEESVEVGIVFNDNGGSQTDDLVRRTDGWYNSSWTDTCPGECPGVIVDTSFDVYFKKPSSWNTAFIYLYDKNANTSISGAPAWPGVEMNEIIGSPWYSYVIDESVEVGIVFNDNGGSQSDDIFRTSNGWYDNQWFDSCPNECPSVDDIKGSFSDKVPGNDSLQLVKAWPNPFTESLTLSFTGNMNDNRVSIEIFNLAGKNTNTTLIKDNKTNTITMDTANLPKGIYLLKIISNKNVKVMKMVK
ncbi:T9SS C-terminal target domain-containing protein [Aquimarina sp. AD1]|uniref:starch-binding protein n=2 Tax=Aquimarina TaxID=290174 RepID=UPI000E4ACEFE|nr:starch-binding protein [Aquimarina sp. AD1]AXT54701.1 T9SS C-terminal target domain-containing protein [Aquimarina sp. AD1]RKN23187.1 starch-binding protein [Aquimarina sp. AD1]